MSQPNKTPDYCFNVDDWDTTYPWDSRDELWIDLCPGDSMEIGCLAQLPQKWACCVVQDDEYVTLLFDNKEEMEAALSKWREEESN